MKKLIAICALLALVIFNSCSSMKVQDFTNNSPRFIPEEYFLGKTKGTGQFWDRFRDLRLSFTVELEGSWDGKILTLKEILKYDSGEIVNREYKITKINDNLYEVSCSDLDGLGKIESYGNALKWSYYLKQKNADSTITLYFDDWMFLRDNGIVLNRAFGQKWGIGIGEVLMSVQKN